jgi:hypothetical protein
VRSGEQIQRRVHQSRIVGSSSTLDGLFGLFDGNAAVVSGHLREGDRGFGIARSVRDGLGLGKQVGRLLLGVGLRHDSRSPSDKQRHRGKVAGRTTPVPD